MNTTVLLGVTLIFLGALALAFRERWKRRLICPTTGTAEDVTVVHRWGDEDKPLRVSACSLFPGAKRVSCHQDCIKKEYIHPA